MPTRRFTVEILGDAKDLEKAVKRTNTSLATIKPAADSAGISLSDITGKAGAVGVGLAGIGTASAAASVVAAGALAGVGLAIAGIGIAAAATSQQVKADFADMAADAKMQMQKAAAPLIPVLTNAAGQFKGIIDQQLAPALGGAFDALAPALNSLVNALGPALKPITGVIEDIAKAAGPVIESIASGLGPLLEGIAGFFKPILAEAGELAPVFGQVFAAVGQLLPIFGQLIAVLAKAGAPLLGPLLDLVVQLAQGLLDGLAPVLPDISAAFLALIKAVTPIIPLAAELFATVLADAAPVLTQLIEALAPVIAQLADELAPVLPDLIDSLFQTQAAFLPLLPVLANLLISLTPLIPIIAGIIEHLLSWDAAVIGPVIGALGKLLSYAPGVFNTVLKVVLGFFGALIDGAANAFGWVPGLGGKLKKAARDFENFKDDVNSQMALINSRKIITLDVVERSTVKKSGTSGAGGTVRRFASGGLALPGLAMVGEEGPELVEFTRPARVIPAGRTRQMLSGASAASGVATAPTVIEIRSDGGRMGELLLQVLREAIRVRGGDVQVVLGRG